VTETINIPNYRVIKATTISAGSSQLFMQLHKNIVDDSKIESSKMREIESSNLGDYSAVPKEERLRESFDTVRFSRLVLSFLLTTRSE
jgi:hypothetical protein